ncbi:hypothetical protein JCM10369A_24940 [Nocardioides pyridinolyticus]
MLLVALAGLMAMHGLSDHGVGGLAGAAGERAGVAVASSPGTTSSISMASGASQSGHAFAAGLADHADHADHAAKTAVVGGSSSSQPAGESGDGHGGHGELLLGVCLAVPAAGLLLRVLVGAFRPLGMFLTRLVDRAAAAVVAVRARARGSACPDLRLLSIQRC